MAIQNASCLFEEALKAASMKARLQALPRFAHEGDFSYRANQVEAYPAHV